MQWGACMQCMARTKRLMRREGQAMSRTEGSVDRGGRGAVDGGDGETVLGGIGKDLADVVTGDDAGGDDIEKTHDGKKEEGK